LVHYYQCVVTDGNVAESVLSIRLVLGTGIWKIDIRITADECRKWQIGSDDSCVLETLNSVNNYICVNCVL